MKRRCFCIAGILLLLAVVTGGVWAWQLYSAVSYFCNREDVVVNTYPNGMILCLEFRSSFTDEDVTQLQRLGFFSVYPLECLYFSNVKFENTIPIPEISILKNLTIVGSPDMDETSLENLLTGKRLIGVTLLERSLPQTLLKRELRLSLQSVWLDEVPISDEEFDHLFSLSETKSLVLNLIPIGKPTIEKILAEGSHIEELTLRGILLTDEDREKLKLLRSIKSLRLIDGE